MPTTKDSAGHFKPADLTSQEVEIRLNKVLDILLGEMHKEGKKKPSDGSNPSNPQN